MLRNRVMRVGRQGQRTGLERFCHCATGVRGGVEIESDWIRRKRERMGAPLRVKVRTTLAWQNLPGWQRGRPSYHLYLRVPRVPHSNRFCALASGAPVSLAAKDWRS